MRQLRRCPNDKEENGITYIIYRCSTVDDRRPDGFHFLPSTSVGDHHVLFVHVICRCKICVKLVVIAIVVIVGCIQHKNLGVDTSTNISNFEKIKGRAELGQFIHLRPSLVGHYKRNRDILDLVEASKSSTTSSRLASSSSYTSSSSSSYASDVASPPLPSPYPLSPSLW